MTAPDPRPPVWVGHVTLPTADLPATHEFMKTLGLRGIAQGDGFAVLELRGGTHLVLLASEEPASGDCYFDLMVDDLAATHARLCAAGLAPSEIQKGAIHSSFDIDSPSGHRIRFNSTHVSNLPV